jgi:hypothetical protein
MDESTSATTGNSKCRDNDGDMSKEGCTYAPIILEAMDVLAAFKKVSAGKFSTLVDIFSAINLHASFFAKLKPLITDVGCTPFFTKSFATFNNSAAKITTEVVPSPTS